MSQKYAWQDELYYETATGKIVGEINKRSDVWSAIVNNAFLGRYLTKDYACKAVEERVNSDA